MEKQNKNNGDFIMVKKNWLKLMKSVKINHSEIMLLCEIECLSHNKDHKPCYASNDYFADILCVDARTIKRYMKTLKDFELVKTFEVRKGQMTTSRSISVQYNKINELIGNEAGDNIDTCSDEPSDNSCKTKGQILYNQGTNFVKAGDSSDTLIRKDKKEKENNNKDSFSAYAEPLSQKQDYLSVMKSTKNIAYHFRFGTNYFKEVYSNVCSELKLNFNAKVWSYPECQRFMEYMDNNYSGELSDCREMIYLSESGDFSLEDNDTSSSTYTYVDKNRDRSDEILSSFKGKIKDVQLAYTCDDSKAYFLTFEDGYELHYPVSFESVQDEINEHYNPESTKKDEYADCEYELPFS